MHPKSLSGPMVGQQTFLRQEGLLAHSRPLQRFRTGRPSKTPRSEMKPLASYCRSPGVLPPGPCNKKQEAYCLQVTKTRRPTVTLMPATLSFRQPVGSDYPRLELNSPVPTPASVGTLSLKHGLPAPGQPGAKKKVARGRFGSGGLRIGLKIGRFRGLRCPGWF